MTLTIQKDDMEIHGRFPRMCLHLTVFGFSLIPFPSGYCLAWRHKTLSWQHFSTCWEFEVTIAFAAGALAGTLGLVGAPSQAENGDTVTQGYVMYPP